MVEISSLYTAFSNLSKAFECIDHVISLEKILGKDVPCFIVNVFRSVFNNSITNVYVKKLKRGVRQGVFALPINYMPLNIYTDEIINKISSEDAGCFSNKVNIQAQADDFYSIPHFVKLWQILLERIQLLFNKHKFNVDSYETVVVVIKTEPILLTMLNFTAMDNY